MAVQIVVKVAIHVQEVVRAVLKLGCRRRVLRAAAYALSSVETIVRLHAQDNAMVAQIPVDLMAVLHVPVPAVLTVAAHLVMSMAVRLVHRHVALIHVPHHATQTVTHIVLQHVQAVARVLAKTPVKILVNMKMLAALCRFYIIRTGLQIMAAFIFNIVPVVLLRTYPALTKTDLWLTIVLLLFR